MLYLAFANYSLQQAIQFPLSFLVAGREEFSQLPQNGEGVRQSGLERLRQRFLLKKKRRKDTFQQCLGVGIQLETMY